MRRIGVAYRIASDRNQVHADRTLAPSATIRGAGRGVPTTALAHTMENDEANERDEASEGGSERDERDSGAHSGIERVVADASLLVIMARQTTELTTFAT